MSRYNPPLTSASPDKEAPPSWCPGEEGSLTEAHPYGDIQDPRTGLPDQGRSLILRSRSRRVPPNDKPHRPTQSPLHRRRTRNQKRRNRSTPITMGTWVIMLIAWSWRDCQNIVSQTSTQRTQKLWQDKFFGTVQRQIQVTAKVKSQWYSTRTLDMKHMSEWYKNDGYILPLYNEMNRSSIMCRPNDTPRKQAKHTQNQKKKKFQKTYSTKSIPKNNKKEEQQQKKDNPKKNNKRTNNSKMIQIFVKMENRTATLTIASSATIGHLKLILKESKQWDTQGQLLYAGKPLYKNELSLLDYGIQANATIHTSQGLRGGTRRLRKSTMAQRRY